MTTTQFQKGPLALNPGGLFFGPSIHTRMIFPTFKAWVDAHESTAFTRARKAAALGTGPDIPDAAIDSHDTAPPWIKDRLTKKHKKGKDKKKDCK